MSAHTCFLSNPLYLIMTHVAILYGLVSYLVLPALLEKYSLFIDSGSANEFFNAWFILIDYADVSFVCKSFEPCISAANLCQAAFLQKVDRLFNFCIYPGKTRQIFGFLFSASFSFSFSEET